MLRGRRIAIPMVSVILPVNGDTEYLNESIQSLRNQTYTSLQIIIVNTSSSRKTSRLLNQIIKEDSRISLIKLSKGTPFQKAAEAGARHAEGHYMIFAEPSHIHSLKRFKTQALYLKNHPASIAVYCKSTVIQKNETKTSDFLPFSLMVNRSKLPFLFTPYDTRCIRELSSYGAIAVLDANLLTLQKPNPRVTTKTHNIIAAFFNTQKKAVSLKKIISGFLPELRIFAGK